MSNTNQVERIFLSPPHLEGNEIDYVKQAFESNFISSVGPMIDGLEQEIAEYTQIPYAVGVTSGTAAIHLGLVALGVEKGDKVITPSFTFIAGVSPILYQNAEPIFMDVSPETWTLDPNLFEDYLKAAEKHGEKIKAVIPTDIYGQSCDLENIAQIAQKYGVKVLCDAAESMGATYNGKSSGYDADAAIYSFNGNKIITGSAGGVLVSHSKELVEKARFLSQQAKDPSPHYQHSTIGFNYRMSNIVAAIIRPQLASLDRRIQKRQSIYERYKKALSHIPGISFMPIADYGTSNYWLTVIKIDESLTGFSRDELRESLADHHIESRSTWKPMHMQPVLQKFSYYGGQVTEKLFDQGLCLPSGSQLSEAQQDRIIHVIQSTAFKR